MDARIREVWDDRQQPGNYKGCPNGCIRLGVSIAGLEKLRRGALVDIFFADLSV